LSGGGGQLLQVFNANVRRAQGFIGATAVGSCWLIFLILAGIESANCGMLAPLRKIDMCSRIRLLLGFLFIVPVFTEAQVRVPSDFQITKITRNLVTTPQFSYAGGQAYPANTSDRWLEVEVEFAAAPEWTDELTFKYYILFNGRLLTGEVTQVNILGGRDNHSVVYVPPSALTRFTGKRPLTPSLVQNIAVQIVQQGAVKNELSLLRAPSEWFASLPQISGFVLNKNETPFAPLNWDRYGQIKGR
jgi:hypothetical protein